MIAVQPAADVGPLVLARVGNAVWAADGACPHRGAPLADGVLEGAVLRCPWHGAMFDLRSGARLRGPECGDLLPYDVRISDDWLFVRRLAAAGEESLCQGPAVNGQTTVPGAGERLRPADLGSLEELLYEGVASYDDPPDHERRVAWIAAAAEHHLATSQVFARLAERQGFTVERLRATGDLACVPLISSGLFKRRDVSAGTRGSVRRCRSSGTRGTESIVPRDQPTLERLTGTVLHGLREFLGHTEAREAFVLSPRAAEAEDVWFAYVLTLVELLYDTRFFVRAGQLRCAELHDALAGLDADVEPAIVAPPGLLVDFLRWMRERSVRLELGTRSGFVVTAGGWKRREDEVVDRAELTALIADRLGIAAARVRDAYNMVELNTVLFDCQHGRKHVPPWLAVLARRPSDMTVAASGEEGLLSFLDPTATSYPAFVLSDDFGRVRSERCPCARHGETLELTRRLATVEQRGCGLKLNRYGQ